MEKRSSNFEILRIVSMFFIISYHYARHGIYTFENSDMSINKFFASFLEIGGQFGVTLFILISGYFLSNKEFKIFRLVKLIVDMWYYSILGVIFTLLTFNHISSYELNKSLFPMIFERYWFVTSYMLLLFLTPYLNLLIKNITMKQFQGIIFILIFIFSIIRTIFMVEINYSNLIWFILLYLIASYIRIYKENFSKQWYRYLIFSIILYLAIVVIVFICDLYAIKNDVFNYYSSYYVKITSFPLFLSAVALFLSVIKIPNFKSRLINNLSVNIFSVYLIHDNDLFRNYMWRNIFNTPKYQYTNYFFIHFIITSLLIFLSCLAIDYFSRKIFLNRLENKFRIYCDKIDLRIKKYV